MEGLIVDNVGLKVGENVAPVAVGPIVGASVTTVGDPLTLGL
jgi:hypothetical protein